MENSLEGHLEMSNSIITELGEQGACAVLLSNPLMLSLPQTFVHWDYDGRVSQ